MFGFPVNLAFNLWLNQLALDIAVNRRMSTTSNLKIIHIFEQSMIALDLAESAAPYVLESCIACP